MTVGIFQQQGHAGNSVLERRPSSPQGRVVCRTPSQLSQQIVIRSRNTDKFSALIAEEAPDRPVAHHPRQCLELPPCRRCVAKRNTQHVRPAETGKLLVLGSVKYVVDEEGRGCDVGGVCIQT